MTDTPVVYTDDPDAHWTFTVTASEGTNNWTPVEAAAKNGTYTIAATWVGDPGATRKVKVPLDQLEPGLHTLYLKVPGGNDFRLGSVWVVDRT